MVVTTALRLARHFRRLARNGIAVGHTVLFLAETLAAGLVCHFRILSSHMDVVLAAGILFVVRTVYN